MSELTLHGYWRSSATYRVRIALALKGVAYEQVAHDLRTGEQSQPAYLAIAPHGLVPAIEHEGGVLIESPAILEWIEARWPSPPLLPASLEAVAVVRAMSALVACDIHPLGNLRVLNALRTEFGASNAQVKSWIAYWFSSGFAALEVLIGAHGGQFAFGDTPTLADCYLVPQLYNAERYEVDCSAYPHLLSAAETARALPAIAAAHPLNQPGSKV